MNPSIYVLAGVNGSGKSSIGGAAFVTQGLPYYNPDVAARKLLGIHPQLSLLMANSHAWSLGKEMLENAITHQETYAFETTLGGRSITDLLIKAAQAGMPVKIWYAGLDAVERNLTRVKARVAKGGHDIPEAAIRQRWDSSRRNLIKLLPHLHSLRLYDNSREADPSEGLPPRPQLLLQISDQKIVGPRQLCTNHNWAKPIIAGACRALGFPLADGP